MNVQNMTEDDLRNLCEGALWRKRMVSSEEWGKASELIMGLLDEKRNRERGHEWLPLVDPVIPSVEDPALPERIKLWTPLIKNEGRFWRFKPVDPFSKAFTWDPETTTEVEFVELGRLYTVHSCAYYGFFKPTIAEVVSQILPEYDEKEHFRTGATFNAFYIDTDVPLGIYRSGSFHRAMTVLGSVR